MTKPDQSYPRPAPALADIEEPVEAVHPLAQKALPGALGWARKHLFNSPVNTMLTLAALWLLWESVPALVNWALVDAAWSVSDPSECRKVDGACWAVVTERHRLMLFGVYPYDQHWRPLAASMLFVAMLAVSAARRFWRPWLFWAWAGALGAIALLMWGGVPGLPYVENDRWGGLPLTLALAVFGIVLAFPLSIVLALGRRSEMPAIRALCVGYIELVRGVPLVSVLFMASVMFPLFLPEGVTIDKLARALAGIVLFTAAYLAEAVRGGLQAIPAGQYEAAASLGLGYWRSMRLIILPQALKTVIPPIVNQFISCFKDTSLVTIVGLFDLLTATKAALADPTWRPYFVEGYAFAAFFYFAFCFFMSRYSQWLERELSAGQGRRA